MISSCPALQFRYIAIEGPIGVGKSALAQRLGTRLDATVMVEDTENPFLADFYADRPGAALQAQLFYLLNRHRQQMTITVTGSREARTHFRVLERFHRHTLLLLQLETGRTHQIRVHLRAIEHPVVGDPVYGSANRSGNLQLKRPFLHAYQLVFTHPSTGAMLELEAPLPPDLALVLRQKSSL